MISEKVVIIVFLVWVYNGKSKVQDVNIQDFYVKRH